MFSSSVNKSGLAFIHASLSLSILTPTQRENQMLRREIQIIYYNNILYYILYIILYSNSHISQRDDLNVPKKNQTRKSTMELVINLKEERHFMRTSLSTLHPSMCRVCTGNYLSLQFPSIYLYRILLEVQFRGNHFLLQLSSHLLDLIHPLKQYKKWPPLVTFRSAPSSPTPTLPTTYRNSKTSQPITSSNYGEEWERNYTQG